MKNILFAFFILLLGTLLAFLIKRISFRVLSRRSEHYSHSLFSFFSTQQLYRFTELISRLLFWLTFIYSISLALKALGFHYFQDLAKNFSSYFPNILTSLVIIVIGLLFANGVSRLISQSKLGGEISSGKNIAKIVYLSLVCVTILLATDQLGVDVKFLTSILLVFLACLLGGAAVSFGIGSADLVTSILAGFYLRKVLKVGQKIEGEGFSGRVVDINSTSILIQTDSGTDIIPTKYMNSHRFRITNV